MIDDSVPSSTQKDVRPLEPQSSATAAAVWVVEDVEETTLFELASVLLSRWRLIVGLPLGMAMLGVVLALLLPPKFTATATFVPEPQSGGTSLPGGLAGLATQFGISMPPANASPDFYAAVLERRTLRDEMLLTAFPDPRSADMTDSTPLIELLDIEGDDQADRLESGRKELRRTVAVSVDQRTRVIGVSVETRYPTLSAHVANHFLELLSRFNLETRQSIGHERRRFSQDRLADAQRELRDAEEALRLFLEQNRLFESSPELQFQYERLQRQVRIKEEIVTILARQFEEARIQEVNDTPLITVMDRAVPPVEKSSPRRKLIVVVGFMLGGVAAVVLSFLRYYANRARTRHAEDYRQFSASWADVKRELRSPFRRSHTARP